MTEYTIQNPLSNTIQIEKSRFITHMYPLQEIETISNIIDNLKEKYPRANHYCYAYRFGTLEKCDDDGEPSKTAGYPILNVLQKKQINHILVVVIRYFGGIKLGTGGLIRAYTHSTLGCLDLANLISLEVIKKVVIFFSYEQENHIQYFLKDVTILQKEHLINVCYTFLIKKSELAKKKEQIYPYIQSWQEVS